VIITYNHKNLFGAKRGMPIQPSFNQRITKEIFGRLFDESDEQSLPLYCQTVHFIYKQQRFTRKYTVSSQFKYVIRGFAIFCIIGSFNALIDLIYDTNYWFS